MGLLISIVVGGIIGWIASLIMKTDAQMGILANILVGVVGSGLGNFLAGMMGLAAYGWAALPLVSIIGAVTLIAVPRYTGVPSQRPPPPRAGTPRPRRCAPSR